MRVPVSTIRRGGLGQLFACCERGARWGASWLFARGQKVVGRSVTVTVKRGSIPRGRRHKTCKI